MRKIVVVLGALLGLVVALALTLYCLTFAGTQSAKVGPQDGFERFVDGISAIYLFELGNGQLAMIDAGNDRTGQKLLEALQAKGKKLEDIAAVFITHSHRDHIATLPLLPHAAVYAAKAEVPLAEGTEAYDSPMSHVLHKYNPHPFKVTHPLEDGEKVVLGNVTVTAYAIPGHTPGSTAYLVNGALFLGDAANYDSDGNLKGPIWLFSSDAKMGLASLKHLYDRLMQDHIEVKFIATAHTGSVPGLASLQKLSAG